MYNNYMHCREGKIHKDHHELHSALYTYTYIVAYTAREWACCLYTTY